MPNSKRKCKHCKNKFEIKEMIQSGLSYVCQVCFNVERDIKRHKQNVADEKNRKAAEKKKRNAERKVEKESLMSYTEHADKTQSIVNEWVRLRDKGRPCESCGCGEWKYRGGQPYKTRWNAGHYIPRGRVAELRFHPDNIHKQCAQCNMYNSGNLTKFRENLIKKIGLEKVEWLEGPHEFYRPTIEELKAIQKKYKTLIKELKKALAH